MFLDEHCGGATSAERSLRAMAERVNPTLWRNHSDRSLSEIAEATTEQRHGLDQMTVTTCGKNFLLTPLYQLTHLPATLARLKYP